MPLLQYSPITCVSKSDSELIRLPEDGRTYQLRYSSYSSVMQRNYAGGTCTFPLELSFSCNLSNIRNVYSAEKLTSRKDYDALLSGLHWRIQTFALRFAKNLPCNICVPIFILPQSRWTELDML